MQILVAKYGLVQNFIILGCVYMVIMAASALYLEPPKASNGGPSGINVKVSSRILSHSQEARKTWQFYALWWIFFTNITCGIGLLAVASPMAQEVVKMTPMAAAPWSVSSV